MSEDGLQQAIEELHQSLGDSPKIDAETMQKMRSLVEEINLAIANFTSETAPAFSKEGLRERLKAFVDDFEVQHPKLTTNLSLIAERLADMGI
jgi:hypothetical protein